MGEVTDHYEKMSMELRDASVMRHPLVKVEYEKVRNHFTWKKKNGKILKFTALTDGHISNILQLLERGDEERKDSWIKLLSKEAIFRRRKNLTKRKYH